MLNQISRTGGEEYYQDRRRGILSGQGERNIIRTGGEEYYHINIEVYNCKFKIIPFFLHLESNLPFLSQNNMYEAE